MKKLFVGLAVVVGSMSFAQQFGIKAGANISSISIQHKKHETNHKRSGGKRRLQMVFRIRLLR